jgi:hypothetical protein
MLSAHRLAGLSALETHYAGVSRACQGALDVADARVVDEAIGVDQMAGMVPVRHAKKRRKNGSRARSAIAVKSQKRP